MDVDNFLFSQVSISNDIVTFQYYVLTENICFMATIYYESKNKGSQNLNGLVKTLLGKVYVLWR